MNFAWIEDNLEKKYTDYAFGLSKDNELFINGWKSSVIIEEVEMRPVDDIIKLLVKENAFEKYKEVRAAAK